MKSYFNPYSQIAIIWSIEDVQGRRPDLSDEQSMQVLLQCERHHDAEIGINWDVIEATAQDMYPQMTTEGE
jgi:hypothetical protein